MISPIKLEKQISLQVSSSSKWMTALDTGDGWPYSTSFFLFKHSPNNAHKSLSIWSPGGDSVRPLSISCGPKFGVDLGKTSWKRARNITRNLNRNRSAVYGTGETNNELSREKALQDQWELTAIFGLSARTYSCGGEG